MENDSRGHGRTVRRRRVYAVLVGLTICAGLASRAEFVGLPPLVGKYAGDALWGLMVFLGLGLLLPARSTAAVAALAAVVSCGVECSQLYRAAWIDAVRGTWPGRMVLGSTFGWGDIVAYQAGIGFGAVGEWAVRRLAFERRSL
jgi:hypothetical protein